MTKITQLTQGNIKDVREELQRRFNEIEKDLGIALTIGSIRFNATTFTGKIEATLTSGYEDVKEALEAKEKANFELYCHSFGLAPSDFKRKFKCQGDTYEVIGINPKKHKYPVIAKCLTGAKTGVQYKMTEQTVKIGFTAIL